MLATDLHIVGIAEACEQQVAAAERRLADHTPVQAAFHRTVLRDQPLPWSPASDDECVYGIALIARGGVSLTDVTTTELPTLDGDPGDYDEEEDRHALCARTSSADRWLRAALVCTTHLTRWEVAEGRRRSQAEHLAGHLSTLTRDREPVLLLADLNARRGDPDIAPLYDWGLNDVGPGNSRDHIMVRDMASGELRAREVGRSDHDLLWTTVDALRE